MIGSSRATAIYLRLFIAALAPTLVLWSLPAVAADAREEAKALSKRAGTAFKLAQFPEALDLYSRAYERFPAPEFLFNLGQCHKNLGHHERALFFFQGYLRDKPDAPNRAAVETLMAESARELAAARAKESAEEAEHRRLEEAEVERLAAEARAAEQRRLAMVPVTLPPPPPPMHGRPRLTTAGAATAGVGGVLLGMGIYFGARASSDQSQLSQLSTSGGTWSSHDQSTYSDGQTSARVATGMYIAGAALVAGLQKHSDAPVVTAGVAPMAGGSSVFVAGRF
jgi:tetratricopeptide (TPR) repeat protein